MCGGRKARWRLSSTVVLWESLYLQWGLEDVHQVLSQEVELYLYIILLESKIGCYWQLAVYENSLNRFAISIPSANVPTLASIAWPSLLSRCISAYISFSGTVKLSINSFSSSDVCGF